MKHITTVAFLAAVFAASACSKKSSKATEVAEPEQPAATDAKKPATTDKAETPAPAGNAASLHNTIFFEFDSSNLSAEARAKLDENAEWLRQDAKRKLTIEGHTDEVGTPEYNLGLGERRARTAQDYLVRLGIAADRVQVITYGEERPASTDDAQNRRSMFIATQKPQNAAK